MSINLEKREGYLKRLKQIRIAVNDMQSLSPLSNIKASFDTLTEEIRTEEKEFYNSISGKLSNASVALPSPTSNSLMTLESVKSNILRALDAVIESANAVLDPYLRSTSKHVPDTKQLNNVITANPAIKQLQAQLLTAQNERDLERREHAKVVQELVRVRESERKLGDKCNELRRNHEQRLQEEEQKWRRAEKLLTQEFDTQRLEIEREHGEKIAALRNAHSSEQQQSKDKLTETSQRVQHFAGLLKQEQNAKAQLEQQLVDLKREAQEQAKTFEAEIQRLNQDAISSEPRVLQQHLQSNLESYPAGLREFVRPLLELTTDLLDVSATDQRLISDKQLERYDLYIYRAPLSYGRVATDGSGKVTSEDMMRVTALQAWAHDWLQNLGVLVINPGMGEPLDASRHKFTEDDEILINDSPARDNMVASVKRIGYEVKGQVQRKAEVKRYVFAGLMPAPAAVPALIQDIVFGQAAEVANSRSEADAPADQTRNAGQEMGAIAESAAIDKPGEAETSNATSAQPDNMRVEQQAEQTTSAPDPIASDLLEDDHLLNLAVSTKRKPVA